jgi:hypothetical protein
MPSHSHLSSNALFWLGVLISALPSVAIASVVIFRAIVNAQKLDRLDEDLEMASNV